jgi:hypothetical protein
MTEGLRNEIEKILSMEEIRFDGFRVRIKTSLLGEILEHDHYLGYSGMRFYRKDKVTELTKRSVHSTMDIKHASSITESSAFLIHEPIRDYFRHIKKLGRYADWAAQDMFNRNKKCAGGILSFALFINSSITMYSNWAFWTVNAGFCSLSLLVTRSFLNTTDSSG